MWIAELKCVICLARWIRQKLYEFVFLMYKCLHNPETINVLFNFIEWASAQLASVKLFEMVRYQKEPNNYLLQSLVGVYTSTELIFYKANQCVFYTLRFKNN